MALSSRSTSGNSSAVDQLEQSFHLLRQAPVPAFLWFYSGAFPFCLVVIYAVGEVTRPERTSYDMGVLGFLVAIAYLWMRCGQSAFCRRLWVIMQGDDQSLPIGKRLRQGVAMLLLQSFWVPAMALGTILVFPAGWVVSMFQSAQALCFTCDLGKAPVFSLIGKSFRSANYSWLGMHGALGVMTVITFFAFLNLIMLIAYVPNLLQSWFAWSTFFTENPVKSLLGTATLTSLGLLCYLVVAPFSAAFFTYRAFQAEAQSSGADLSARLNQVTRSRASGESSPSSLRRTKVSLSALFLAFGGLFLFAEAHAAPGEVENLKRVIQEVGQSSKYDWNTESDLKGANEEREKGWFAEQLEGMVDFLGRVRETVRQFFRDLFDRQPNPAPRSEPRSFDGSGLLTLFRVIVIVVAVGLVAWIIFLIVEKLRETPAEASDSDIEVDTIDLESEDLLATDLSEKEWVELAHEKTGEGDPRLAMRALFLASLASLNEKGLLLIKKEKSNRDYRHELRRKAHRSGVSVLDFAGLVRHFEDVWYGSHEADSDSLAAMQLTHRKLFERVPEDRHHPGERA